jgi:hypothetical protein
MPAVGGYGSRLSVRQQSPLGRMSRIHSGYLEHNLTCLFYTQVPHLILKSRSRLFRFGNLDMTSADLPRGA